MRRQRRTDEGDDSSVLGTAGWLFADLMLGLAVVFLAMNLVGRDGDGKTSKPVAPTTTTTTTVPKPVALQTTPQRIDFAGASGRDAKSLSDQVLFETANRGKNARVGFALVWGCGASPGVGKSLAERIKVDLVTAPDLRRLFGPVDPRAYWDGQCGSGDAYVELWFYA